MKGLTSLKVTLAESADLSRRYVVRLHFLEPDAVLPGERVFNIRLQEQTVCPSLDVVKDAGGRQRALVKEFTGVMIEDDLLIELVPGETARLRETILSGIEIKAEGW